MSVWGWVDLHARDWRWTPQQSFDAWKLSNGKQVFYWKFRWLCGGVAVDNEAAAE